MACGPGVSGDGDSGASGGLSLSSADATGLGDSSTGEPPEACGLVPDGGNCDAAFPRWYFDQATGRCAEFTWGGCDGVVPFEDFASCSIACEACETQTAAPTPSVVRVTIHNDTDTTIYLEGVQPDASPGYFRNQEYILIEDATGAVLASHAESCEAEYSCSSLPAGDWLCDPGAPMRPGAIHLAPGASYDAVEWDSLVWSDGGLANECLEAEFQDAYGPVAPCRRHSPYLGTFVVATARASEVLDGEDCEPSSSGWCRTGTGAVASNPTLEAVTGFDLPTDAVDLRFVR